MEVSRSLFVFLRICILGTTLITFTQGTSYVEVKKARCYESSPPECKNMNYSSVILPNILGHASPEEAWEKMRSSPLDETKCAQKFKCALYFPPCTVLEHAIPPCRSICDEAYRECGSYMWERELVWPEEWNCERFPEPGQLCIDVAATKTNKSATESESINRERLKNKAGSRHGSRGQGDRRGQGSNRNKGHASQRTCQSLRSSICSELGYNLTSFPNYLGHENQEQAAFEINSFFPLIKIECSSFLREFLCAAYYPQCSANQDEVVLPCRRLCLKAYSGCFTVMARFGFEWPESLSCDRFPDSTNCWNGRKTGIINSREELSKTITESEVPERHKQVASECKPMISPTCAYLSYNMTRFPNPLGHIHNEEAEIAIRSFLPLVRVQCSRQIQDFLCGAHFPQCGANQQDVILPCKSLCLKALSGCEPYISRFRLILPRSLACERFPDGGYCWNGEKKETTTHPAFKTTRREAERVVRPTPTAVSESITVATILPKPAKNASRPGFPLGQGLPSGTQFVQPILKWLKSSAKLNYAQAKLAGEQAKVAKLTSKKLSLEIARLKKEG
ncbi:hypothetical protein PoB_002990500 [Plakobranchus ocellatus]|uniref:FZ domain-containing protein n=1 Tax=Plakobranchus ocellatus TaxID=259542 RepID=A0AAV4A5G5_9GAST|nr:hypothetical protein PoB_002990500 [Plakobranchus ocellatus]